MKGHSNNNNNIIKQVYKSAPLSSSLHISGRILLTTQAQQQVGWNLNELSRAIWW